MSDLSWKFSRLVRGVTGSVNSRELAKVVTECLLETAGTSSNFWLGKGKLHHAIYGHEQWVVDNFPDLALEHSGGDEEREQQRYENYAIAEKAGYIRATRIHDTLYLDTTTYERDWADLSRKDRKAVEDYAFASNLAVIFDGITVLERPHGPSAS